ncbi:glutathione S-transferase [Roseibium denhamense]|uniref:Glutathione S-transferase n=1 Tax=Roseibium denhamense TaxID=76305 RepID=A0ABY1PPK8_9HYPH|nr:glutathione S-transferase [Roseibium denhamense]MTI05747.1 glutathione S-transferase [Roseibium denhamense]SMP36979.1 Glutathione S-transferase [Roseibium denhamense]
MTTLPILYSFRRCPYAMRARLALLSSGMTVELREIVLRDKAPEFLETSPSGTVPCLTNEGRVIDESLDIMLWTLEQHDPEGWLQPAGGTLDEMIALISTCDGPFKRHLDRYKYDTRYADADPVVERTAASEFLLSLEERLKGQPWLFGPKASLADFAILPFVRQFANADRAWFDAEDWPALKEWLSGFETSGQFQAIMPKWSKWHAGNAPVFFPLEQAVT